MLYVDDLFIASNCNKTIMGIKSNLEATFDMTDLGALHYFLGIEIRQMKDKILVLQTKYAKSLLKKFKMEDYKPVGTPCAKGTKLLKDMKKPIVNGTLYIQLVESLIYLTHTGLDIMYITGLVSHYM